MVERIELRDGQDHLDTRSVIIFVTDGAELPFQLDPSVTTVTPHHVHQPGSCRPVLMDHWRHCLEMVQRSARLCRKICDKVSFELTVCCLMSLARPQCAHKAVADDKMELEQTRHRFVSLRR